MNKKTIILSIILLLVIAGAVIGYNLLTADEDGQVSQNSGSGFEPFKAVDFYFYDGNGEKVYLSDFYGKPIIVNFWATWCGPCRSEFPVLESIYEKYGDEAVFLMINQTDGQRDTVESVKEFVKENELDFPVYYDIDLNGTMTYGVYSIPLTFMVDEQGSVVNAHMGPVSEEVLLDFLGK